MDVEQFHAAGNALLDRVDQRLDVTTRELVHEFLWADEWGLFVDELAAALTHDQIPIDATERDLLRELLYALEPEGDDEKYLPRIWNRDEVMASLNVIDAKVSRRAS